MKRPLLSIEMWVPIRFKKIRPDEERELRLLCGRGRHIERTFIELLLCSLTQQTIYLDEINDGVRVR